MESPAFEVDVLPRDAPIARVEAWLAIRNALDAWPISLELFNLRTAAEIAAERLEVRLEGQLVAVGVAAWDVIRQAADEATVQAYVLPRHRNVGIGSALWTRLGRFVRDGGISHVACHVVGDDAGSLAFATHRGLEVVGTQQLGTLDLDVSNPPPAPVLPAGLSIVSMGDRADLHRALHAHLVEVLPEVPSWGEVPVPDYEAWEAMIAEPGYRKDLSLVALEGEQILGQIDVDNDGQGRAFITMLSVAPHARRRGVARALKQELAHRAATAGWNGLVTLNDGTNAGIRRLNEELGYSYLPEVLLLHGPAPNR